MFAIFTIFIFIVFYYFYYFFMFTIFKVIKILIKMTIKVPATPPATPRLGASRCIAFKAFPKHIAYKSTFRTKPDRAPRFGVTARSLHGTI